MAVRKRIPAWKRRSREMTTRMRHRIVYWGTCLAISLMMAGCTLVLTGQTAHYGHDGAYKLQDSRVTPGAVNAGLIADPSGRPHMVAGVEANLCAKDFRTVPYRHTSEATKKKACAEYGAQACPGPNWEVDHLISLEIGGADELGNLWPQPIGEARVKDHQTEDVLPKLICSGKIGLKDAQTCIRGDWVKCGARVRALEGQ